MRYAIYFTPAASDPLTVAAQAWLGRNAYTGLPMPSPALAGLTPVAVRQMTAEPRRYGFHATLVAPFRLRPGLSDRVLSEFAADFAGSRQSFMLPRLAVGRIGSFLALVPAPAVPQVDALATAAVEHFGPLRAPLSTDDMERRRPERLTPRQRAYLDRYGYPFVREEFRFHMTLTGALDPAALDRVEPGVAALLAPALEAPVAISALTIFVEPVPGADFIVHSSHAFAPAAARKTA